MIVRHLPATLPSCKHSDCAGNAEMRALCEASLGIWPVVMTTHYGPVDNDGTIVATFREVSDTGYTSYRLRMVIGEGTTVAVETRNVQVMSDVWEDHTYAWIATGDRRVPFRRVFVRSEYYPAAAELRDYVEIDAPAAIIGDFAVYERQVRVAKLLASRFARRAKDREIAEQERRTPAKGKTIRVVKGRKVKIGTVGECIWYGAGKSFSYYSRPMRVGLKTSPNAEPIWLDANNVEVVLDEVQEGKAA